MEANQIVPMFYKVREAEVAVATKGPTVGKKYAKCVVVPQNIDASNYRETHTLFFFDEFLANEVEKYLAALEEGKPVSQWSGLFTNIKATIAMVKMPMYQPKRIDGTFGAPRDTMQVFCLLRADNSLSVDPKNEARRIIEQAEWRYVVAEQLPPMAAAPDAVQEPVQAPRFDPVTGQPLA